MNYRNIYRIVDNRFNYIINLLDIQFGGEFGPFIQKQMKPKLAIPLCFVLILWYFFFNWWCSYFISCIPHFNSHIKPPHKLQILFLVIYNKIKVIWNIKCMFSNQSIRDNNIHWCDRKKNPKSIGIGLNNYKLIWPFLGFTAKSILNHNCPSLGRKNNVISKWI